MISFSSIISIDVPVKETESQVIARTVQIDDIPSDWQNVDEVSDYLCKTAKQLGYGELIVTDQKMIDFKTPR